MENVRIVNLERSTRQLSFTALVDDCANFTACAYIVQSLEEHRHRRNRQHNAVVLLKPFQIVAREKYPITVVLRYWNEQFVSVCVAHNEHRVPGLWPAKRRLSLVRINEGHHFALFMLTVQWMRPHEEDCLSRESDYNVETFNHCCHPALLVLCVRFRVYNKSVFMSINETQSLRSVSASASASRRSTYQPRETCRAPGRWVLKLIFGLRYVGSRSLMNMMSVRAPTRP